MNIENCRLRKINFKDAGNKFIWGITLMAKNRVFEFYTITQQEREEWASSLSRYVVMLDVKEEYAIG